MSVCAFFCFGVGFGVSDVRLGFRVSGVKNRVQGLGFAVKWRISGFILRQCIFARVVV